MQELYPDLTPINIKDDFEVSKNEEVYLFRIPKLINPQCLLNKEFDLLQGSKLKINNEKYELEPSNKTPNPFLLVGNRSRAIQPRNIFFLKKYIKPSKMPDLDLIEKAMVPLPENLKPRHPLFGANYEDKIQLRDDVEKRLQKAIKDCFKQTEKLKKKKKKTKPVDDTQNEVIFSLLGSHTTHRNNSEDDSAFGSSETQFISTKTKKSKRKSLEEPVHIESEKQLSSMKTAEVSPKKKKKHKLKRSVEIQSLMQDVKAEVLDENEQVSFNELSAIVPVGSEKSYKKKRRSSVFGSGVMLESTRIDVKDEPLEKITSKKQSFIDETLNRIKTELLTEYESEWDETLTKKKKKKKRKSLQDEEILQNGITEDIKQEIMSDYKPTLSNKRKRTMSTVEEGNYSGEVTVKKSKKANKNSNFSNSMFSLENEVDSLLEKVKKDKKMKWSV